TVTLYTKNGGIWLEAIEATCCDAVGLDWTINLGDAKLRVGDKVALQGILDPSMLHATPDRIRQEVGTI
ncbi:uroporphyrinogen decarboxylase family protein, partial [Pseudoalteromonas sp. S1612]|uniref:uroporphyrinogen decarboxylase family protein n=1 Tax=Pseudoalteromonas sp. S1612 TaxID=579507 RepID=UPI00127603B2